MIWKILLKVRDGQYNSQIARQLGLKKQNIAYFLKKLEKNGYIQRKFRSNFVFYELTDKGKEFLKGQSQNFSLSSRKGHSRLHNLVISFPILEDNPDASFGKEVSLNNWVSKYSVISFPIGITIQKTPRNVIAHFHQFETSKEMFLTDFYNWILKGVYYLYYYLMREKRIKIDIFDGRVIRQHISNEEPDLNEKIDQKMTTQIDLNRKAKSIFQTQENARAWIDRSYGNVEIETNDMLYEEKFLKMPELIYELSQNFAPAIEKLTQQINLHLEVMQQIKEAIGKLNEILDKRGEVKDGVQKDKII